MKSTTLMIAAAAIAMFAQSAQAREHHYRYHHHRLISRNFEKPRSGWTPGGEFAWQPQPFAAPGGFGFTAPGFENRPQRTAYSGHNDGRPAAWCGWEMRRLVSGDPGPAYNLARNWAHWGRSGPAGVGAVVVWPHHVGKIVGQENGEWVIESGNDGHALRTRSRSIAGAIAIRWG
ncbi:MAG: hypothetical protein WBC94_06985 [Xanthobacteraceae bacterium]|jgi:hypothetical protein